MTKAQKDEKVAAKAERLRKIHRTADRNHERLRAKVERRSDAGTEGLGQSVNGCAKGLKSGNKCKTEAHG